MGSLDHLWLHFTEMGRYSADDHLELLARAVAPHLREMEPEMVERSHDWKISAPDYTVKTGQGSPGELSDRRLDSQRRGFKN